MLTLLLPGIGQIILAIYKLAKGCMKCCSKPAEDNTYRVQVTPEIQKALDDIKKQQVENERLIAEMQQNRDVMNATFALHGVNLL